MKGGRGGLPPAAVFDLPAQSCTLVSMKTLRARVQAGRLVLDEPTSLPEGTEIDLVLIDDAEEPDAGERARLDDQLEQAWESAQQGRTITAEDAMRELEAFEVALGQR
jgi:hypothetical protein